MAERTGSPVTAFTMRAERIPPWIGRALVVLGAGRGLDDGLDGASLPQRHSKSATPAAATRPHIGENGTRISAFGQIE